jgi:hypothetical protein
VDTGKKQEGVTQMVQLLRTAIETSDRRTAVSSVLASFRMEGLEPDVGTAAIMEEYAAGSTSLSLWNSSARQ